VLRVGKDGLKSLWENDESLSAHFSTPVYHDGFLYGFHGRQEDGAQFRCVDWKTGKVRWSKDGFGCGSILVADGILLVLSEGGELVLVEPTSSGYREKARAEVLSGPVRAQPALSEGRLYVRDGTKLVCWNLKKYRASGPLTPRHGRHVGSTRCQAGLRNGTTHHGRLQPQFRCGTQQFGNVLARVSPKLGTADTALRIVGV